MSRKYRSKDYSKFSDSDAKVIGVFLDKNFKNKGIKTKDLLKMAESPDSPIHKYFEWDDKKAAYQYRLDQARDMIQCVYIEVDGIETRAYENVYVSGGREYRQIENIMKVPDLIDQVIEKAFSELEFWKRKYDNFKQFQKVYIAINQTKGDLYGKEKRKNHHYSKA